LVFGLPLRALSAFREPCAKFLHDVIIAFGPVRHEALAAILDAPAHDEVASALLPQAIQGTKTEQAVELAVVVYLVAGKILALRVAEKPVAVFHALSRLASEKTQT
jgi:hypothetical protein